MRSGYIVRKEIRVDAAALFIITTIFNQGPQSME